MNKHLRLMVPDMWALDRLFLADCIVSVAVAVCVFAVGDWLYFGMCVMLPVDFVVVLKVVEVQNIALVMVRLSQTDFLMTMSDRIKNNTE